MHSRPDAGEAWRVLGASSIDDAGRAVRTAWNTDVSQCQDLGKVTVMDRVGPIDRNDIKVRGELEVMARNQAAQMHADTIKPLSEPSDGSQPWGAYCWPEFCDAGAAGRHQQHAGAAAGRPQRRLPDLSDPESLSCRVGRGRQPAPRANFAIDGTPLRGPWSTAYGSGAVSRANKDCAWPR